MYKVTITLSKNGKSPMILVDQPFCTCKSIIGLKRVIRNKYEQIYGNCRRLLGNGNCKAEFRCNGNLVASMNIDVM